MNKKLLAPVLMSCLVALGLFGAAAVHAADAPQAGPSPDPARWYEADDSPKARLRNLNQETAAAYAEALAACKPLKGKEAAACRRQAQQARKDDAARARRIHDDYQRSLKDDS
ncbi:hypothetical protein ABIC71_002562 [Herbaspirillum seropedicae]|uniref:hypothetical protein n=1 Tax=Herbaspirillum seropedicae TaxID=964 RepID=UPI003397F149